MTDAAAQAAMKRAIAIDEFADLELDASDRILQEIQAAAPAARRSSRPARQHGWFGPMRTRRPHSPS
jgi:hypothetical protein